MAMEPITLFSLRPDLAGVLPQLRAWNLDVTLTGSDDDWRDAKVIVDFEGQPGPLALTFRRDPSYYAEPNWSQQVGGMQNYFRSFPAAPGKDAAIQFLGRLRSALATIWEPDMVTGQRDERISLVLAVARQFDCVLFRPSALLDSSGRPLLSLDGEVDEAAQLPPTQ